MLLCSIFSVPPTFLMPPILLQMDNRELQSYNSETYVSYAAGFEERDEHIMLVYSPDR